MAVAADLRAVMQDTITWERFLGVDRYSEPLGYGAAVKIPCRVEDSNQEIRTTDGLVKVARARLYLSDTYAIDPKDRITLPDGSQPVILQVFQYTVAIPNVMNWTEVVS